MRDKLPDSVGDDVFWLLVFFLFYGGPLAAFLMFE